MSELFKKVEMTKIEPPKGNDEFIKSVQAEIKRQLDDRIIQQSKEIGLRNSLRRK